MTVFLVRHLKADEPIDSDGPSLAEQLIACLEDDAAKLKDENPEDEMAQTMLDAAEFIAHAQPVQAEPTNPYSIGLPNENWRRGYNGERFLGYAGSPAEVFYKEGKAAASQAKPVQADAPHSDSADEAQKLARILFGLCEGGGIGEDVDIYADGFQAADGDVYVYRAAELLAVMAGENRMLGSLIKLLESKMTAVQADALDAARYRWLRGLADGAETELFVGVDSPKYPRAWALIGEAADAAIDTAMARSKT